MKITNFDISFELDPDAYKTYDILAKIGYETNVIKNSNIKIPGGENELIKAFKNEFGVKPVGNPKDGFNYEGAVSTGRFQDVVSFLKDWLKKCTKDSWIILIRCIEGSIQRYLLTPRYSIFFRDERDYLLLEEIEYAIELSSGVKLPYNKIIEVFLDYTPNKETTVMAKIQLTQDIWLISYQEDGSIKINAYKHIDTYCGNLEK